MAATGKQDALKLLAQDHREVEALFEKFEKAKDDDKKEQIARQICTELKVHAMIEEEIFYPALEGKIDEDDLKEAYVEHDGAKVLINDIEAGSRESEFYDAKVKVLQEEIEHHVKEEERRLDVLFTHARKADLDMDVLGEEMAVRKAELTPEFETSGIPKPKLTTMEQASV